MSHQTLNKDNYNAFVQFDKMAELINELIFILFDRNKRSLNIANTTNNNINNEINDYQFTFDVPNETEIQKDMEDILKKKKKNTNAASSQCSTTIINRKRNRG